MRADILEQFFAQYYNDALLYSLSLTKNKELAEEIVSTAFFKALHTADGDIRDFKSWLLTVCRNMYYSHHRRQSRHTELQEHLTDDREAVVDQIIKDEEYRALYHAIGLLPKDQNEVITLFYFENLPVKAISAVTGKKETHIKVLLYRARENLRNILEVKQ